MQKTSLNSLVAILRVCIVVFVLALVSLVLFSFTVNRFEEGFLKQLGIGKTEAEEKITNSILGGYLDTYGARNAKNILLNERAAVANDLLTYTKRHVHSDAFKKEYEWMRQKHKPVENKIQTPEEMRKESIEAYKKSVADMEEIVKKADAAMKPIFESSLAESKKHLKEAEDPNSKIYTSYVKNYPSMVKFSGEAYQLQLQSWENEYPSNHLLFVKKRLEQFLDETRDIDFTAGLTSKNGKKYFVNPVYERKSSRWKMAFRAGREVVGSSRAFIEAWLQEIR